MEDQDTHKFGEEEREICRSVTKEGFAIVVKQ